MALLKERKQEIKEEFKVSKNDTGSSEIQIALLTERINGLSDHFKKNKKDNHSRRGLLRMVNRRKKLLAYLQKDNPEKYKEIISRLGLRK